MAIKEEEEEKQKERKMINERMLEYYDQVKDQIVLRPDPYK